MNLCQVPGCTKHANHSQLHNVIAALIDACDLLDAHDADGDEVYRLRAVARRATHPFDSKRSAR